MQASQLKVRGVQTPLFGFQKSQQASNIKLIQRIESESSCQAAGADSNRIHHSSLSYFDRRRRRRRKRDGDRAMATAGESSSLYPNRIGRRYNRARRHLLNRH